VTGRTTHTPLRRIGYSHDAVLFQNALAIVPFSETSGTAVDLLLIARHLLSVAFRRGDAEFRTILSAIRTAASRDVYFQFLSQRLIEFADLFVSPNPFSFFVPCFCEKVVPIVTDALPPMQIVHSGERTYIAAYGGLGEIIVNSQICVQANEWRVIEGNTISSIEFQGAAKQWRFVITECPMSFNSIAIDLAQWCPHHSHQLACLEGGFPQHVFLNLSFSTRFSYETAAFMWALLQSRVKATVTFNEY
jgi:hypothetical protein